MFVSMEANINQRVKMLRSSLDMNQQYFATKIKTSLVTVSRMESGTNEPRQSTLFSIIRAFNVSEKWLLYGEGEMFGPGGAKTKQLDQPNKTVEVLESKVDHLEKEILFYRDLLLSLSHKVAANFNDAFGLAGQSVDGKFQGKIIEMFAESVRVSA